MNELTRAQARANEAPERGFEEPSLPSGRVALAETAALTVGVLAIGWAIDHEDPWFLHSRFPWAMLAPLLAGMRYGFAFGFGSALTIVISLAAAWRAHVLPGDEFPSQLAIGLTLVGMISGELCDIWVRRIRRQALLNDYRRMRLDEFTRAYHVLKVSHDRLEQRLAGSTKSLREALMTLQRDVNVASRQGAGEPLFGLGRAILALFGAYGWLQSAVLHAVDGERLGEPLGELGHGPPLDRNNPLLREALRAKKLMAVRSAESAEGSTLLLAMPLVDVRGRVWAVVAVRDILFVALNDDNLRLLAVLCGHIADILAAGPTLTPTGMPSRSEFVAHLERSLDDRRAHDLPAALVRIRLTDPAQVATLTALVLSMRRGLDQILVVEDAAETQVLVLLPLTDPVGVDAYVARIGGAVQRQSGQLPAALGMTMEPHNLARDQRAQPLLRRWITLEGADAGTVGDGRAGGHP